MTNDKNSDEQNILIDKENISELLQKAENYEELDQVKDLCVNILTTTDQYNLCFIDFETENHLGVYRTHKDGTERFVLLAKKYITSISVVYQQDVSTDTPNVSEFI